jgi:hypothetical protein
MNLSPFSRPFRMAVQIALLLAILLFNLGTVSVAYAAPPPANDDFATATVVGGIAYTDIVDTTQADVEPNDPTNIGSTISGGCDGYVLAQGYKSVWYKYTAPTKGIIEADTFGTDSSPDPRVEYDTYIAVWTGSALTNLTLVACDDDTPAGKDAQATWRAKAGVTYYVEVAQFKCYVTNCSNPQFPTTLQFLHFQMNFGGGPDTTGVFRPSNGILFLKNYNTTGFADVALNYGLGGDYPVVGDWDGNGTVTIGVYRNGSFYLRNHNTIGFADAVVPFGAPGDQPIAGDWNDDGVDTIGLYRPTNGQFFLRNSNTPGNPDITFFLGNVGDVGIAGDWNNDGIDTTGVFRPSNGVIFLKNTNDSGFADLALNYGIPGDMPVTGDWDGNGTDTIGVYRGNTFYLRNDNSVGFADLVFALGNLGDMPIAGNWDGVPNQ